MTELIIALLMIVNGEIKEHRIQESMSACLKGKRIAMRETKKSVNFVVPKPGQPVSTDKPIDLKKWWIQSMP